MASVVTMLNKYVGLFADAEKLIIAFITSRLD